MHCRPFDRTSPGKPPIPPLQRQPSVDNLQPPSDRSRGKYSANQDAAAQYNRSRNVLKRNADAPPPPVKYDEIPRREDTAPQPSPAPASASRARSDYPEKTHSTCKY